MTPTIFADESEPVRDPLERAGRGDGLHLVPNTPERAPGDDEQVAGDESQPRTPEASGSERLPVEVAEKVPGAGGPPPTGTEICSTVCPRCRLEDSATGGCGPAISVGHSGIDPSAAYLEQRFRRSRT